MWLYLAALLGLYFLRRWYREQQTVENLREKHVLITGCDSGFGNLLARQLDARGLRVLAACLTPQGAEQLRQATSERLQTVILDVTRSDSIAAAAAWVKVQVGDKGLWGLVNNAGIMGKSAPNEWLTKDDFATVLNVNLLGPIEVTLSLLPLVKRARGRGVNAGHAPIVEESRRELLPFGVKISIIEPGAFQTPILNVQKVTDMIQEVWDRTPAEVKEAYGQSYFDTYRKEILQLFTTASPNLSLVTDCMEHALTARHPRTRYSGGWDAQFYYIPVSYLPTSWQDFLATRQQPKPAHGI
nr:17-beta-hydroxysteroid dehydrogenase type 6-like [Pelodiscus sinensis]|eukprot:XP_006130883.1 17-beta-hydroxysteroid dehydrogenase type 6-like [Pelodiscus sinensis]